MANLFILCLTFSVHHLTIMLFKWQNCLLYEVFLAQKKGGKQHDIVERLPVLKPIKLGLIVKPIFKKLHS